MEISEFPLKLDWSDPVSIDSPAGSRVFRKAPIPHEYRRPFLNLWSSEQDKWTGQGYRFARIGYKWEVSHLEKSKSESETKALSEAMDSDLEIPVPEGIDYFPFQKAGIEFCCKRKNALVADEMGLGKTIQAIGLMNRLDLGRVLVICPAGLKLNWKRELEKWSVEDRDIHLIYGKSEWPVSVEDDPNRKSNFLFDGAGKDGCLSPKGVVIINYDILGKFLRPLRRVSWDLMVADEAQYIKNDKAKRTKYLVGGRISTKFSGGSTVTKTIKPIKADYRVLLTGTPIMNKPIELWTMLHYLDPKEWSNWRAFVTRYCRGYYDGSRWLADGASNLPELQDRLRSKLMIRRMKKDVLKELPDKIRSIVVLDANTLEEKNALKKEKSTLSELVGMTKMAELAAIAKVRHETALAKVPTVVDNLKLVLESIGKVVVFAHHRNVVTGIQRNLERAGVRCVSITGETPAGEREKAVQDFQEKDEVQVFLGTIGAAGTGITLTAASHVVFVELSWSPSAISQAEDRCARIGQKNSVQVQHLVLENSIDLQVADNIIRKQKVIDKALNSGEDIQEIGLEDLFPTKKRAGL